MAASGDSRELHDRLRRPHVARISFSTGAPIIGQPHQDELRTRALAAMTAEWLSPRSAVELDVVIPVLRKDWRILPWVIRAVRRRVRHPIRKIHLVGPERPEPWDFPDSARIVFLPEQEVAPLRKEEIDVRPNGWDRSGWLLQQFIKLSSDEFCTADHILVLDADTVLLRPQRFIRRGKVVLSVSDERHEPYYEAIRRLFPALDPFPRSFVSHHMVFQVDVLRRLKAELTRGGVPWFRVILDSVDRNEVSCFSEYELYGTFAVNRFPERLLIEHFMNVSYAARRVRSLPFIRARHPFSKSVSFHTR